jgi:hypothetical protein
VKHRLNDLDILRVRIEYAEVPKAWTGTKKAASIVGNKVLGIVPDFLAKLFQP